MDELFRFILSRSSAPPVFQFWLGIFKIVIASLLAGAAMNALNLTADDLLAMAGLSQERLLELAAKGWSWALPNILLGSIIILPAWFVLALLRPPRARD
jgi:hypothetical protein